MASAGATGPGENDAAELPDEFHPRHLLIRVAEVLAVVAVAALAINSVPGLDEVRSRLGHAEVGWLVGIAVAEIGSCAGYLLVFRETFCASMPWRLSYDIAMSELAANSLLPAGGAGGLALGVWALRQGGMPTGHIARRTVAFFVVTSAANFLALVVVGIGVFAGLIPGSGSVLLTLLPAVVTGAATALVALSPELLRRWALTSTVGPQAGCGRRGRDVVGRVLATAADGVEHAVALLRSRSFGVIAGSFAYMAFDIAALGCGFAAVGHAPAWGTLTLAYLIGQLGNLVPLPGGIGGTEGALVGMFALYGVDVAEATAVVFAYRLFQLLVPALVGAPAFVALRRKLSAADRPALMCAPLGLEVVKLPPRG
jgi:uncharacterized protein (TIRG00374 family)